MFVCLRRTETAEPENILCIYTLIKYNAQERTTKNVDMRKISTLDIYICKCFLCNCAKII